MAGMSKSAFRKLTQSGPKGALLEIPEDEGRAGQTADPPADVGASQGEAADTPVREPPEPTRPAVNVEPSFRTDPGYDRRIAVLAAETREPVSTDDFAQAISRLWGRAQDAFLEIGRYLIKAKRRLPHGHYQTMIERSLPFQSNTARMLRQVAERYDSIPHERLPNNYSVLYYVTTLTESELAEAERRELLRPTVTRAQITAFKAEMRRSLIERREMLERRRDEILRLRQELYEELLRIQQEIGGAVIEGEAVDVTLD